MSRRTGWRARRAASPPGRRTRRSGLPKRSRTMRPRRAGCWCGARSSTRSPAPRPACATAWSAWNSGSAALARTLRLARIVGIGLRFGLHEFFPGLSHNVFLRLFSGRRSEPRAQRLREALEALGPIFVKFGQVLSTRRDLLPLDIADELAKLQDQVPPFDPELAVAEIEKSLGGKTEKIFKTFER